VQPHLRLTSVIPLLALLALPVAAQADRGPSTPEERERAVKVAKVLRTDPLNAANVPDREWLVKWLIEVPDISIEVCTSFLGDLGKDKSGYPGAIIAAQLASEAAFVIEHPDRAKDTDAVSLAGVEGALDAYQAINKQDPKYKRKQLDDLLDRRAKGTLADFVKDVAAKSCKK
jgi:hypothetical protein